MLTPELEPDRLKTEILKPKNEKIKNPANVKRTPTTFFKGTL